MIQPTADPPVWTLLLLLSVLVAGTATSLVLPLVVLRYKRRLAHFMNVVGLSAPDRLPEQRRSAPSVPPPSFSLNGEPSRCSEASQLVRWMRDRTNRLACFYATGLLPFMGALAALWLLWDQGFVEDPSFRMWLALMVGWGVYVVVMFLALGEPTRRTRWLMSGGAGTLVAVASLVLGSNLFPLVLISTGPAAFVGWLVARRSVRAVGPAVFLAVVAGLGSVIVAVHIGFLVLETNLNAAGMTVAVVLGLLGLLIGLGLAGAVMIALSRAYAVHRVGDNELKALTWALVFFLVLATTVAPGVGHGAALFLLAWPLYWVLVRWGLSVFVTPHGPKAPRLLFLRTFRPGGAARSALRAAEGLWRTWGPVDVIAAPDVAADTFEVDELEKLIRGRTRELFERVQADDGSSVAHPAGLEPGARYRVVERFCTGDAWQSVVRGLARNSAAVLFDARGFTTGHSGAAYEIGLLMDTVDLDRVVWLLDANTDTTFLQELVQGHWPQLAARSPNRSRPRQMRVLHADQLRGKTELIEWVAAAAVC